MSFDRSRPWYWDRGEVVALVRWLHARGDVTTVEAAVDVFEEPWHYTVERAMMIRERAAGAAA